MADFIQNTLDNAGPNGVLLFSNSSCPFCSRAKNDLRNIGIIPVVVELDERQDGGEIQAALTELTGQRTVPSAWVCGRYIGGSDDLRDQINVGLFDFLRKLKSEKYAEKAGIKPCGCHDGAPCLSVPVQ
eukprot:CAMPEP_0113619914 /NCGR_PEP_ID=MMETSP0017_2-20120614/10129_1 /TAXON_ID=2856 /ORGANISM="Cylindrotheca closterium" /LENGTH=128 /DNA_ID=CAMNT_0000529531 /DNA_START=12 /DNA_END=398 /DNA_ORIENTATION=+ /assembly_acc=CAM_ASM_000147